MAQGTQRIDRAECLIRAPALRIWQAWTDPGELVRWLPPPGMDGKILVFDPRPGGVFDMVLTYEEDAGAPGKTDASSDHVEGEFVALDPPNALSLAIRFRSDDPRFAGVMRMDWSFVETGAGTHVTVAASDVPDGIRPEDHAAGLTASLEQLARHIGATPSLPE